MMSFWRLQENNFVINIYVYLYMNMHKFTERIFYAAFNKV